MTHALTDLTLAVAASLIVTIMVALGGAAIARFTSNEIWALEPTIHVPGLVTCREAT